LGLIIGERRNLFIIIYLRWACVVGYGTYGSLSMSSYP
jgi:hypothetical protein